MFGIGGFNPVSLLATTALGPMGGIVAQLATQIFSQVGQQIIQQMGQQLNLPQSVIDSTQGSFAATNGDLGGGIANVNDSIAALGQETRASLSDIGTQQRETQETLNELVNELGQSEEAREAKAGGRATGWLRAMAEVLGKKLDAAAHEMQDLANKIDKEDPSTTTDFQVASQEFNMLMNAANTAIKSIGEAMANTARKQ